MEREEAFYHKILLMSCLDDGYNEWLNRCVETENPLSDIVLELAYCSSDINKTISVLNRYCTEEQVDMADVNDKVRLFFRNAYHSKKMSKEEITTYMQRVAFNIGDMENQNITIWDSSSIRKPDFAVWESMYFLADYCQLAEEGIISWERFDFAFFSYLYNGTPIDTNLLWKRNDIE